MFPPNPAGISLTAGAADGWETGQTRQDERDQMCSAMVQWPGQTLIACVAQHGNVCHVLQFEPFSPFAPTRMNLGVTARYHCAQGLQQGPESLAGGAVAGVPAL